MTHRALRRTAIAAAFGLFAWAFRLLSAADLTNDHYMHMAWAQQILFGDLPGRDFADPGMPLTYAISGFAQWIRPGPFTELVLSAGLMGLAAGVVYAATEWLSGSMIIAAAVTLLDIGLLTRLYSYPKILAPALALLLLQRYLAQPAPRHLVTLGLWIAGAILLRHDLGLYLAAGVATGLIVHHGTTWVQTGRAAATCMAGAAAVLIPYALFVQWTEGIVEHLRRGIEFAKGEAHQRVFELPAIPGPALTTWGREDASAFLFYTMHVVAIAAVAHLILGRRRHPRARLAAAAAATAMLAGYLAVILRYPLDARIPDMAAVFAAVCAWLLADIVAGLRLGLPARRWAALVPAVAAILVAAATARSVWVLENLSDAIDNTGLYGGFEDIVETYDDLHQKGTDWPWARSWPSRDLPPAIPYLDACTRPTDAVLLTWAAPEYNFFARRRFAAGHAEFLPPDAFTTERDQDQMLTWLRAQRVPVALINDTRRQEFATAYPKVDTYVREVYRPAGQFQIYDGSTIIVATRADMPATETWGPEAWPCRFGEPAR